MRNQKPYRLLIFFLVFMSLGPLSVQAVDDSVIELLVNKNDNLINLCRKYLEDPNKWPEIARINRLDNSNYILPGRRLIIPVRLLKPMPIDGLVVFIKGDVTAQTTGIMLWKPLQLTDLVHEGDLIKIGHESAVEITYNDGTTFYLEPDTVMKLTTSQQKGNANTWHRFLLSTGRMLMKIHRATGTEPRNEIQTPAAALLARGTEFRVSIDMKETTISEVLQGIVEAEAAGQMVLIREGEGTRINKGEPPLTPRKLLPPPTLLEIQSFYSKMPFSLRFNQVEGAVAYRILFSKDELGKDVIRDEVIKIGESMEVAGLENGTFYLQSRSIDDIGLEGASLAPQAITIHVKPLPPTIQPPALDKEELHIQWSDQGEHMTYHAQIARDKNFLNPVLDTKVDQPKITVPIPRGTGNYYVRISTIDPAGYEGEFASSQSIEIQSRWPLAVIGIMGIIAVVLLHIL